MSLKTIKLPEDLLWKIAHLGGRTDEIIGKVLKAGAEVVRDRVDRNLDWAISPFTKYPSRSTGELQGSLGVSPVATDNKGQDNIKIGFSEPRKKQPAKKSKYGNGQLTNAMIGNILERGKQGQEKRPFMKDVDKTTKTAVEAAMQAAFDSEFNKL
jgi:hypothetical protein